MRLPDSETSSSPCNQSESRAPFSGRCTSHNIAARFLLPLTPKCCSFKQTKQNTLKRLLNESHTWLEEMSKRRTWELQEEFDRDEKMRLEESQQQRNDLEARHAAETQELKDQIYGLMHKTTKYSKVAACADPKPEFAETALLLVEKLPLGPRLTARYRPTCRRCWRCMRSSSPCRPRSGTTKPQNIKS